MPTLLSQILMRPWLYSVAIANALLLGLLSVILFLPPGAGSPLAFLSPARPGPDRTSHPAEESIATAASTSQESPQFYDPSNTGSLPAINSVAPASSARATTSADSPAEQSLPLAASDVEYSSHSGGEGFTTAPGSVPQNDGHAQPASALLPEGKTESASQKPQDVAIPLAYTTPDDGTTPSQQAALGRLRNDFANSINSLGADPSSPEYKRVWQQEQEMNDSRFEQQFGTEAFIQAQLAQYHQGASQPAP